MPTPRQVVPNGAPYTTPKPKCRLCQCRLTEDEDDDFERELCSSCRSRPEARQLNATIAAVAPAPRTLSAVPRPTNPDRAARDFTPAERSLISKVHGYLPTANLLTLLNERLLCDLGPDAAPYTITQLHAAIGQSKPVVTPGALDWPALRKMLANARRSGVLHQITEQRINDFAVVYSLSPKQLLTLKDIVLPALGDLQ